MGTEINQIEKKEIGTSKEYGCACGRMRRRGMIIGMALGMGIGSWLGGSSSDMFAYGMGIGMLAGTLVGHILDLRSDSKKNCELEG